MTQMHSPFYLIVDSTRLLAPCLEMGVKLVQLRMKNASPDDLKAEITRASDLCRVYDATLIVNDHWQLAAELDCQWVHLGQEDLYDADIPFLRRRNIRFGISTHDEAELLNALDYRPDYVALGPIYETKLKKMKWPPQGLQKLIQWKSCLGAIPLVAIGGLTPERGLAALSSGADVVAAVTDIATAPDPAARCKIWLDMTEKAVDNAL